MTQDNLTGVYTNYCYDSANRLIMADPGNVGPTRYTYDANGNRTETTYGSTTQTQTVNAADQLTMPGYSYDGAGNTRTDSHGTATYNGADQLTALANNAGTHTYTYAGTDQTELIAEGNGRTYTYGRTGQTGLPLIESFVSSGTTYGYLYDPAGTPLAIQAGTNTHYLGLDGLGSVIAAVNHTGTHTAAWTYDPWGKMTATALNGSGIASPTATPAACPTATPTSCTSATAGTTRPPAASPNPTPAVKTRTRTCTPAAIPSTQP